LLVADSFGAVGPLIFTVAAVFLKIALVLGGQFLTIVANEVLRLTTKFVLGVFAIDLYGALVGCRNETTIIAFESFDLRTVYFVGTVGAVGLRIAAIEEQDAGTIRALKIVTIVETVSKL